VTSPEYTPAQLAALFARVERDLAAADTQSTLDVLVHTAVDIVAGAQMAGISLGRNGKFSTPAATDDVVLQVDEIQYGLGSGPCVDAIKEDTTFNVSDLRTDPRWPTFGETTFEQNGIVSMLSFRMYLEQDAELVAGLNLYSREPAAFADTSEAIGMLLATHGALAVSNAAAREKANNLLVALKTNRDIGVAIGVLMHRYKITRDEAFNLLRMASQGLHRKLADIAMTVAETGELPDAPKPTS
jgi:GAF domain-containing protein